ncbi:uncharacterized protein LOC100201866 isoform X3 [Hydra vulgaris]|uniref:Uncharacterized protein LOC100201866 isoform X3 n=1 Tax=Hydra vulgaris TaxID=6087 RepID=A0ABM4CQ61_HYDVU
MNDNEFVFSEEPTLEILRQMMESFASERNWNQFHTPRNLILALVGEVGELSELFQWKGDDEPIANWPVAEQIHLGEELSDVLLYLIRLADICNVDLPNAADYLLKISNKVNSENGAGYTDEVSTAKVFSAHPNLEDIRKMSNSKALNHSPRNLLFSIVGAVGKISELSGWKSDGEILRASQKDRITFAEKLTVLLLYLVQLAEKCNIDLPKVAFRKYNLNVEKYPVRLVNGSSKKYNEYANKSSY